jgi:large subunit ribosomal protein L21
MYAVVEYKGHQHIVKEGDNLVVDNVDAEIGKSVVLDKVLLAFDDKGEKVIIGTPYIPKAEVVAEVTTHQKADKVRTLKFKRKNRYQRTI